MPTTYGLEVFMEMAAQRRRHRWLCQLEPKENIQIMKGAQDREPQVVIGQQCTVQLVFEQEK